MKTILLLLLLAICLFTASSAQNWNWARAAVSGGNVSHDEGESVAIDASGNVLIAGFFQSTTISFGSTTLTSAGAADLFLAKYDSSGNVLWAKAAGGSNDEYPTSIALDADGCAFVAGSFASSTLVFGTDTLANMAGNDVFLVKYDPAGNVQWARRAGGPGGTCSGNAAATDRDGNIYLTGSFSTSSFDIGPFNYTNSGGIDVFIAKYDSMGNVLWAETGIGTGDDVGKGIAVDALGNLYLAGGARNTLRFDSMTLNFASVGDHAFLLKLDPQGNAVWIKGSDGEGVAYVNALALDQLGNAYLAGTFSYAPTINFGPFTLQNVQQFTRDAFLVKYDSLGNEAWAKSAGGYGDENGYSVVIGPQNDVYLAGGSPTNPFPSISFGALSLTYPPGSLDPMFVVKYDAAGNANCGFTLPSGGDDFQALAVDPADNLYIGGNFGVDPFILGTDTLTLSGNETVYAAKFRFQCAVVSIHPTQPRHELVASPNPFSSETSLRWGQPLANGKLTVCNSIGTVVKCIENLDCDSMLLDCSSLPTGCFLLHLTDDEGFVGTCHLYILGKD